MTQVSKTGSIYTRIKLYAEVYGIDTTKLDIDVLSSIYRTALANEWSLVGDKFKAISEGGR